MASHPWFEKQMYKYQENPDALMALGATLRSRMMHDLFHAFFTGLKRSLRWLNR